MSGWSAPPTTLTCRSRISSVLTGCSPYRCTRRRRRRRRDRWGPAGWPAARAACRCAGRSASRAARTRSCVPSTSPSVSGNSACEQTSSSAKTSSPTRTTATSTSASSTRTARAVGDLDSAGTAACSRARSAQPGLDRVHQPLLQLGHADPVDHVGEEARARPGGGPRPRGCRAPAGRTAAGRRSGRSRSRARRRRSRRSRSRGWAPSRPGRRRTAPGCGSARRCGCSSACGRMRTSPIQTVRAPCPSSAFL